MSNLLINESPLQVLPTLACAIGLNEAVIVQQMHYWMKDSQHFYDGRRWIYNSVASWQKQFPFWSEATIKRALGSLESQGVIVSGNYNRDPRDRSKWYSINYVILSTIESSTQPVNNAFGQFDQMEQCNMTKCNVADCTNAPGQDDPMQMVNMTQPLPEITTETTQEITTEIKKPKKNSQPDKQSDDLPDKTENKKPKQPHIEYRAFFDAYNEILGDRLPWAKDITEQRKVALRRLLPKLKTPTVEGFRAYLSAFSTRAKSFYFGDNDRRWRANIDFLLREKTLVGVREGTVFESTEETE
ncbi:replication protein RepO [Salmonella enterica subsp. enterica]|nr:replication protein RepO [Salmonella enterica subsp. enterica]ECI0980219.1 replication protein RepO [Salmonella enterica subsp. enterica serovar Newport]ECO0902140.1 replication protein RepO [Salmonella enterica subsp. enterica serovar Newport]ECO1010797.1 replication protein RepO [Salmonella enterica subsp. enterica serovar Newport]EDQ2991416.1 replication protein RepO [Salmonella enterica subsp. enterica]